jgi:hypothetical protein
MGPDLRVRSSNELIYSEICRVGRYTVEKGYVDSFFGNISYFDGKTIFISQTTSSLDELEGHIDPVPLDGSSTAGLSASSELPAHRGIYLFSNYHAILHGHPRFSIVMSMFCTEEYCTIEDCNRYCDRKRTVCGVPVVAGETGAGGLDTVPLAEGEWRPHCLWSRHIRSRKGLSGGHENGGSGRTGRKDI